MMRIYCTHTHTHTHTYIYIYIYIYIHEVGRHVLPGGLRGDEAAVYGDGKG